MKRTVYAAAIGILFLVAGAGTILGDEPVAESSLLRAPKATIMGGMGNAMGWFGAQGEYYFDQGRWSAFVGIGYTPDTEDDNGYDRDAPPGPTFAFGGRAFAGGLKHRAFLEASLSQLAWASYSSSYDDLETKRSYGPGIQVGYQRIALSGFTFLVSVGVGYSFDDDIDDPVVGLAGLGIGGSWR